MPVFRRILVSAESQGPLISFYWQADVWHILSFKHACAKHNLDIKHYAYTPQKVVGDT